MVRLILSLCLIAQETWGNVYFFDTFMDRKRTGWIDKCKYVVLYLICVSAAPIENFLYSTGIGVYSMGIRVLVTIMAYIIFCVMFYQADWKQCIFFSILAYLLLFLIDYFLLMVELLLNLGNKLNDLEFDFLYFPARLCWIFLLLVLRRIWKGKNSYRAISHKEWREFGIVPLFTLVSMLLMYFSFSCEKKVQAAYLFLAAGLIVINFLVLVLMQDLLLKGELLRENALTDQKKESELSHYRDMQVVYERQGRKLHDYKNQIRTMQVLLKDGDAQSAVELAERLTESISVDMAAVDTKHPVVNAVLNQKYHAAREQGVSMIFRVSDMREIRLNEEEIVILLSNLLDNAIRECVKIVQNGRKAVISIKLVQEAGKMIFSVKNPVMEKAEAADGIAASPDGGMHGVGLLNVQAVIDKYYGDFAVSCDGEKFQAVVMI